METFLIAIFAFFTRSRVEGVVGYRELRGRWQNAAQQSHPPETHEQTDPNGK